MKRSVILLVDDEKIILDSLRDQILSRFGQKYDVEVAEGGQEGLEIIEEVTSEGRELALVISDHLMPGMKGDEFLILVHQEYPETLKILLTGQASLESVGNAINKARIYRYVVKPWDEHDLLLSVEKALTSFDQYLQLKEYNRLLQSLNVAIQDISSEVSYTKVIRKVLQSSMGNTHAEKGYLLLEEDGKLQVAGMSSIRKEDEQKMLEAFQRDRNAVTAELINKVFGALGSEAAEKHRLVSAIQKKGKNIGYVFLENPFSRDIFNDSQRHVLEMLASQAAISLENARLYENLAEKTDILERTNEIIRQKNEDITSSIQYAKRIQEATLPDINLLRNFVWDSSLLFLPKDIVSGDFYWWLEKDNYFLIGAADCTGHGVPGGFMSILAHNALNEAVNVYGLVEPNAILQFISFKLRDTLNQDTQSITKDGVDIALLAIDRAKQHLMFSGARRPMVYVRAGQVEEIRGNKVSIGEAADPDSEDDVFRNYTFEIEPGDTIYLFSDGLADQFGGDDDRRFSRKRLYDLIQSIQRYPAAHHAELIYRAISAWQGDKVQTDDMLLIVFRL